MLTGEIRNQVDQVWNAFWSGGVSNPLSVIEQITYLLFIKRLDDLHTLEESKAETLGIPMERLVFPKGNDGRGRPYADMVCLIPARWDLNRSTSRRAGCSKSRIRFDVRVEALAAIVRCTVSEVAKLSRLRVRQGTGLCPGRALRYRGRGSRGPTRRDLRDAAQEKLTEARACLICLNTGSGSRFLKRSGAECPPALNSCAHGGDGRRRPSPSRVLARPGAISGVDLAFLHRRKVGVGAIARVRRQLRRLLAQIGFDGVGDRRD